MQHLENIIGNNQIGQYLIRMVKTNLIRRVKRQFSKLLCI